jgi:urease accessory protein UreH
VTGSLDVVAEAPARRTILTELRAGGLLRASRPLRDGRDAALLLTTVLGPGLLHGDRHVVRGRVGDGAALAVGATAATKVYGGARESTIESYWSVAAGGSLVLRAEPTIAFAGARFCSTSRIELARDARFVATELLARLPDDPGCRVEVRTFVRCAGTLLAHDVQRASPRWTIGTLLATASDNVDAELDALSEGLAGARVGIGRLAGGMLLVRVLGTVAWQVRDALGACSAHVLAHG